MPNTVAENAWLHVAVGVILSPDRQQVLLACRPAGKHQAGKWEFPGGKVEPDETVQLALQRELREELALDIDPDHLQPLIEVRHHYPERSVWLDVWLIQHFQGEPIGLEGQLIAWYPLESLTSLSFPAANDPIVAAVLALNKP